MPIRFLIVAVFIALAPTLTWAQPDSQDELKARLAEELSKEYIKFGGWEMDYEKAKARAKKEGKYLFAYFTRSYAY